MPISATVRTTDRTGVEMEALTAVAVAGLTLHDMIKAVDPAAVLDAVRVERKDGGKTGTWTQAGGTLNDRPTQDSGGDHRLHPGGDRGVPGPHRPGDRGLVQAKGFRRAPGRRSAPTDRT